MFAPQTAKRVHEEGQCAAYCARRGSAKAASANPQSFGLKWPPVVNATCQLRPMPPVDAFSAITMDA